MEKYRLVRETPYVKPGVAHGSQGTRILYDTRRYSLISNCSEKTGKRGGMHNSLTRIMVKPTHLIGGYAQLSFAFNYLGPTGNQRDEVTIIRRRSQEVTY